MPNVSRRSVLVSGTVLAALPRHGSSLAAAGGGPESHGLATFGDLHLPADFAALPYVAPDAPKGGRIVLQSGATFDTLNAYVMRGSAAAGMAAVFDSLMAASLDEPDARYGLLARSVRWSPDKLTYRFRLRPEARFHDRSPLTAADVVFSLEILKAKGHPNMRAGLRHLDSVEAEAPDVVTIKLHPARSRDLALIVAGLPIFSKAYYTAHDFDRATLDPPLGSGPYRVGALDQGRFIVFERVADYWAKDLPVNVGQGNFDVVRYEYFRERQVGFEAFKSGVTTVHEDFTAIHWAKGYDIPAVADGRVMRRTMPDRAPRGAQAWWMNIRRAPFKDARIRQALGLAFDFEWTNRNIMFGFYRRIWSYFQNSSMAATGTPGPDELTLLEPFRGKVADTVFGEAILPPTSDGSGQDRARLGQAVKLLQAAGCRRDGNVLKLADGSPFRIEFLDSSSALERHASAFIRNLRLLGIDADLRLVDAAQFQARLQTFDFDVVPIRYGASVTPGEGLRTVYGSEAARTPGSDNFTGMADEVIDALIEKALVAQSRAELDTICKCLDRVLRAGHYWIPMWYNPDRWLAYWDLFGQPPRPPNYSSGVPATWWFDKDKAERVKMGG